MINLHIPESFKTKIVGAFGENGKQWLETLEETVKMYAGQWHLQIDGPVDNLSYNYVLKAVNDKGTPVILKLGVPGFDFKNEIKTVLAYGGNGCANVLEWDAEGGGMLLEQLIPGQMLVGEEEGQAIQHFVTVWQAIRCPVPDGLDCPKIMDWAKGLDRYLEDHPNDTGPIDKETIKRAQGYFKEIFDTSDGSELLHGDLHHQNILYSEEKGWMAIDPKGVVGDPYFSFTAFMVNEIHNKPSPKERFIARANRLIEMLELDRGRFLKAGVAMATLSACWGIEDHDEEWIYAFTCAEWFQELLDM
ncbi:aminoglycoside phosphotransferase family protein [Aquibacillus koreensis]|uniref:Aminoglycoside phosphotransferase family protein n=1 Tax=Aquibacillus koreensis TaxID=279446 RepID=A0A9X3WS08_9BACI|nr:aminoglycoside phosphotransferase family protein [Aquibacillus koreensis]MCT2535449.1 aminoglycoside phosphotransferase family protein [Aquibacillus koreensis]MDC3422284.1 aminoglycoside phosphotransferase family protein [Aquibacillus koreensis]